MIMYVYYIAHMYATAVVQKERGKKKSEEKKRKINCLYDFIYKQNSVNLMCIL